MAPWFWTTPTPATQISQSPPKDSSSEPPKPTPQSNPSIQESSTSNPESSIAAYLQNLESSTQTASVKFKRTPQTPSSETLEPPIGRLEDELLPTDISARAAFDSAFYCQSLGGKFNDLYRYGEIKSCSHHWKEFWFAMKMKSMREPIRSDMIKDYYRQKALKYKHSPSSEDIWKSRDELLHPKEIFPSPFPDERNMSNEEWCARQEELRKYLETRNQSSGSD